VLKVVSLTHVHFWMGSKMASGDAIMFKGEYRRANRGWFAPGYD
jgi:hypothetical protein